MSRAASRTCLLNESEVLLNKNSHSVTVVDTPVSYLLMIPGMLIIMHWIVQIVLQALLIQPLLCLILTLY